MIARLICLLKGHRRGVLSFESDTHRFFKCPRCGRQMRYKKPVASLPPVPPQ